MRMLLFLIIYIILSPIVIPVFLLIIIGEIASGIHTWIMDIEKMPYILPASIIIWILILYFLIK